MSGQVFQLRTERHAAGQLTVVSFRGVEELSRPFGFEILCVGTGIDEAALSEDFLGRKASLLFHGPGELRRWVHGIVRRVEAEGVWGDLEDRHRYRIWLAPRLWTLGRNRQSRVFQDMTVQGIVDQVLAESHVTRRWSLSGSLSQRAYCVQYEESDLRFVERLLAEEGLVYSFDHAEDEDGEETVVFRDDTRVCPPISGSPVLVFRDSAGMSERDEDVARFRSGARVRPHATLVRHFDFLRPSLDVSGMADQRGTTAPETHTPRPPDRSDTGLLRVYDHRTELGEVAGDPARVAERHLEQHRSRAALASGESRCRRLSAGSWFELTGAAVHEHDGRHLLVRVEHEGRHPEAAGVMAGGGDPGDVYSNRFTCVPAGVRHRPRRPKRRLQQVMETATVVGPPGQEIHTDSHGRIRVQFHWDRQGHFNQQSSCWIRVMQAWAGAGWGFQFIPRVGMEVVVTFEGGDTDRPMVVGCAYNAAHPPPFRLPAEKTKSGIRTESSRGGGGHNELSFEDRKGFEQIYVHAEKDLQGRVKNNVYTTVGGDSTYRVAKSHVVQVGERSLFTVGGTSITVVEGDARLSAGGELHESAQRAASRHVGGDYSFVAGGRGTERWESSLERTVSADLAEDVQGNRTERAGGGSKSIVGGAAGLHVHEGLEVDVGGEIGLAVGEGLRAMVGAREAPTVVTISDAGKMDVSAAKVLSFTGSDRVVVRTDEASVRIDGDTLVLAAKKIRIQAETVELVGSGSSLRLGGDIDGAGKNVKLKSESDAKLELGATANLAGAKVNLGSAAAAQTVSSESASSRGETRETTIHLHDRSGRKLSNAPYEISYPGYFARGTSGDGTVRVTAPDGVESVRVRWGRGAADREPGSLAPELEFTTEVFIAVDAPDADEALRRKLHNLGHRARDVGAAAREHHLATGGEGEGELDEVRGSVDEMHSAARAPGGQTS